VEKKNEEARIQKKKRGKWWRRRRNTLSDSPRPFLRARPVHNSVTLVLASWTIEVHCQGKWRFLGISVSDTKRRGSLKIASSSLVNEVSRPEGPFPQQMMDNTNIQWPLLCHKTSSLKHILQPNWSAHPIRIVGVVFITLLTIAIRWTSCRANKKNKQTRASLYLIVRGHWHRKVLWYFWTHAFTGIHWIWNVIW
jgi:hypothetical protein